MRPPFSAILLTAALGASCGTSNVSQAPAAAQPAQPAAQPVQPGAPGTESRPITTAQATDTSRVQFTPADVEFMQGMIGHHAQAVEMVAMIPSRTTDPAMRALGQRIDISQADEIKMMQGWLKTRGQTVPDQNEMKKHIDMGMTDMAMPGMLTKPEMERLAASTGKEFERLFLEGMIKHHGGAIMMVEKLFATPGAGQDSEIYAFASDVDADQRMEIIRMGNMLQERQQ
jgi:uncharacterized protein (DUF305 family)